MSLTNPLITCPKCHHEFSPTEQLSKDIEKELALKYQKQFEKEKEEVIRRAKEDLAQKALVAVKDMENQVTETKRALKDAQDNQLQLLKKNRELQEKTSSIELEMQKQLETQRAAIKDEAAREATEKLQLKLNEKDLKLESMTRQIEDLKRKAEQGSQQLQGDAYQMEVERTLRAGFPRDLIAPVPKGKNGADFLQTVLTSDEKPAGIILIEAKNTKTWGKDWIEKALKDQQNEKALFAVIVSEVLPKDIRRTGFKDGVWITDFANLAPLVMALRFHMLDLYQARVANVGRGEKLGLLYSYITENEFKTRIETAIKGFRHLRESLQEEKLHMQRVWAYREKCHEQVLGNVMGMVGDIQGIVGRSIPLIAELEARALPPMPGGSEDGEE